MAKRTTKARGKSAGRSSKKKTDPEKNRRITIASVVAVGVLATAGAGWVGVDRLDARADAVLSRVEPTVVFEWPALDAAASANNTDESATWMPTSERERLHRMAADALAGGAGLDVSPLRDASAALSDTGWFEGSARVERAGDGSVRVSGDWRPYAAVVRVGWLERLIAWDGVALPLEYDVGKSGLRYIANPSEPVPPKAKGGVHGPWGGDEIGGGLRLLRLLGEDAAVFAQVAGIDLNRGEGLEIVTDEGSRILWGAAPGVFRAGEVTTERKLDSLSALLEKTGRIDAHEARVEINGPYVLTAPGPRG